MDERDLVLAAKAGDAEAFADLVRRYAASLRAMVSLARLQAEDVNDIVQDAFLDAFRALDRFDAQREFGPWLRVICRNRLLKFVRDRAGRHCHELAVVEGILAALPDDPVSDASRRRIDALRLCLRELEGRHRTVIGLRFQDGLAVKDIATRLGTSANAVSVLLFSLKESLRRCIDGHERREQRGGA